MWGVWFWQCLYNFGKLGVSALISVSLLIFIPSILGVLNVSPILGSKNPFDRTVPKILKNNT